MARAGEIETTREEKEYFVLQFKIPEDVEWRSGVQDTEHYKAMENLTFYRMMHPKTQFRTVLVRETNVKEMVILAD
jgi:hypothetical protein